jgi:hypothetical protein
VEQENPDVPELLRKPLFQLWSRVRLERSMSPHYERVDEDEYEWTPVEGIAD